MMTATRSLVGAVALLLAFNLSGAWAEPPAAEDDKADGNEQLASLDWLIGGWEGGWANFVKDDIKYFATNDYRRILDGHVLLEEFTNRNSEGQVTHRGISFFFVDPETKSLRHRTFTSLGYQNEATLTDVDANSSTWEMRIIQPSGKQGHYRYRLGKDAEGGFRKGWSKVSGEGGNNLGMSFRKLATGERKTGGDPEIQSPEALQKLDWLLGSWRADRDEDGTTEAKISWILNGKAMLSEWALKDADGKVVEQGRTVYYMDPVRRQPAVWSITQTGIVNRGTLSEMTEDGVTWRIRVVWPDGGQGHYTKRISKTGEGGYEAVWSKISGTGPDSYGPNRFEPPEGDEVAKDNPAAEDDVQGDQP